MKPTISLLMVLLVLGMMACQSDKAPANNVAQSPNMATPATTAVVQHYICPNNCAGSGSAQAGTCPVCGTQYMHNAAFHNQPGAANNTQLPPSPVMTNPQPVTSQQVPQNQQVQTPITEEPAQNAAGVWHYVCSKGCEGGSGKRGFCAKCGAGLDHNPKYHQM